MEGMASLCNYHQESIDELKFKIYHTALELEAVKAKSNEELNRSTESLNQLLQLVKLVCHERDEAKLLIQTMSSIKDTMISDCFNIDQVHLYHQNPPIMKAAKANSSMAESNCLSDAYNHSSAPVDSLFEPVSSPDFSISFVQDYGHQVMFQSLGSVPIIDHATLMMDGMINGKSLPQKGNLLQAVMEAGPLLQTLLVANRLPSCHNLSVLQSFSFSPMTVGGGVSILSFDDAKGRMVAGCPNASNFRLVEKRQRF